MTLFGETVRVLRGNRSQAELAHKAGLNSAVWSRYETGTHRPRAENLARLLAALGTTREEFEDTRWLVGQGTRSLYRAEDPPAVRRRVRFLLDGLAAAMLELLLALRPQPPTKPPRTDRPDRAVPAPGSSTFSE